MKITKSYLKQLIKEEVEKMEEANVEIPMGGRGYATKDLGMGVKQHMGPLVGVEAEYNTRVEQLRKVAEAMARSDFQISPEQLRELFSEILRIHSYLWSKIPADPSASVD